MNILNLRTLNIINAKETEHDYGIEAESTETPYICPRCGTFDGQFLKYGSKQQMFWDLPMHGKRVGIFLKRQRYKCKDCEETFLQRLSDFDEKRQCTVRLIKYIEKESLKRTFKSVADEIGMDEKTIRNINTDHIGRLDSGRRIVTPTWLGIDEIHILRKPRCVITNVREQTLLDLLENRNKPTVIEYLSTLPEPHKVQVVTMDMWNPYRDAVHQALPQAEIVVDKFHVVRMANQAVETIRKELRSELDVKARRQLKNDRFLMLTRQRDLSYMQQVIVDSWTLNFPKLRQAYELKESFYNIWDDSKDAKEAEERFQVWKATIPEEMKPAFHDIIRAYKNWNVEINNYFRHRATNAYTESLNNLTRYVNRMGRGYSFKVLRAKMLYSVGVKTEQRPRFNKNMMDAHFVNMKMTFDDLPRVIGVDLSTLIQHLQDGTL